MSDGVVIAWIVAGQSVTVALIGLLANRLRKVGRDGAAVRAQVENHHVDEWGKPINMRDENDRRHNETRGWFESLGRSIGGLRDDLRAVSARLTTLEQLEITDPRKRHHE